MPVLASFYLLAIESSDSSTGNLDLSLFSAGDGEEGSYSINTSHAFIWLIQHSITFYFNMLFCCSLGTVHLLFPTLSII